MAQKKNYSSYIAKMGVLVACAMVLSYVEAQIPPLVAIPGIKLGLANLAVIMALYLLDTKSAVIISLVRVLLVSILFGNMMAFAYSLAGAVLSLVGMATLRRIPCFSTVAVSISGGVLHNVGQIAVAVAITETEILWGYLPALLVSGLVSGALIGLVSALLVMRLSKYLAKEKKDQQ